MFIENFRLLGGRHFAPSELVCKRMTLHTARDEALIKSSHHHDGIEDDAASVAVFIAPQPIRTLYGNRTHCPRIWHCPRRSFDLRSVGRSLRWSEPRHTSSGGASMSSFLSAHPSNLPTNPSILLFSVQILLMVEKDRVHNPVTTEDVNRKFRGTILVSPRHLPDKLGEFRMTFWSPQKSARSIGSGEMGTWLCNIGTPVQYYRGRAHTQM